MLTYNIKHNFFSVTLFGYNKPAIDAMNGLNKRRKATSASTFDFSIWYTKLSQNKLLMVLNSLIDFCLMEEKVNILQLIVVGFVW